jgi:hypothetical protein
VTADFSQGIARGCGYRYRWSNGACLRRLSHVNPYGVFNLDLSTRLPIDEAA